MEMKELFGEEKSKDLFKFIEENYDLGQDRIVEKWIVMEFEKNQKWFEVVLSFLSSLSILFRNGKNQGCKS